LEDVKGCEMRKSQLRRGRGIPNGGGMEMKPIKRAF
jgi:hypothetical protein